MLFAAAMLEDVWKFLCFFCRQREKLVVYFVFYGSFCHFWKSKDQSNTFMGSKFFSSCKHLVWWAKVKIYFENQQLKVVILVSLIFAEDTKVIFHYSFRAPLNWKYHKKILICFYQNMKSLINMKCFYLVEFLLITIAISTSSQKVWILSRCCCFCFAYISLILGNMALS